MPAPPQVVEEPGVYDLPDGVYHSDPVPAGSLSSSGVRLLLKAPALYRDAVDNGQPPKRIWDLGHVAHAEVLGAGHVAAWIDAPDWRKKSTREAGEVARAAGLIPVLVKDRDRVEAMAAKLREHPLAGPLFDAARGGKPEQSLFHHDPAADVWRRGRLDWLPPKPAAGQRMILADYKTCADASPDAVRKAIHRNGYHIQAVWNTQLVVALKLAERAAFVDVFQEREPPYLVTVAQPDAQSWRCAEYDIQRAVRLFGECRESGNWPGYNGDELLLAELPAYALYDYPSEVRL